MTPDEVCEALTKIGANVSRRTLLHYEEAGLIPTPTRGGGRNGRYTHYPEYTVEEAFAAWALIHGKFSTNNYLFNKMINSISPNMIKFVRDHYYSEVQSENIAISSKEWNRKEKSANLPSEEYFSKMYHEAAKHINYGIQQLWLSECKRAELLLKNDE